MKIVIDNAGKVLMWSEDGAPAPGIGQQLVGLADDQAVAFLRASTTANNELIFDGQSFTPLPPPPSPIPQEVTPLQIRRALRQLGMLEQVNTYVSAQDGGVQDAWQFAIAIPRNDPLVVAAAAALGVDADALFRLAGTFT